MRFRNGTAGSEVDNMFIKRLFSTIILLGLFGGSVFAPNPWNRIIFFLLSSLLTFALVREICDIVKHLGMGTLKNTTALVCTFSVIFMNLTIFSLLPIPLRYSQLILFPIGMILFYGIAVGGPLFILFSKNSGEKIKKLFNSIAILLFVLLPVFCILLIYNIGKEIPSSKHGFNLFFLIFVLLTKIGDIGAYVIGTLSNKLMKGGNHKMVPSISPGKSWEGAAGGLIVTVLLAIGFHYWLPDVTVVSQIPLAVVTGILMFFACVAGDLMESVLKRAAGVKDSGSIIPGIGGVFDLVDSLFVTAPVFLLIYYTKLDLSDIISEFF